MPNQLDVYFNGVNGATGDYLTPPLKAEQLLAAALGEGESPKAHLNELKAKKWEKDPNNPTYAPLPWFDPKNLADAGWGVIFLRKSDPAIRAALMPLLNLRRQQATATKDRFRIYAGDEGYLPDDTKDDFLAREPRRMGPGPANPDIVPYYLLIVGSPEEVPYQFQYQLDVQYGVGRVWFDTVEEYANYARSVVAAETGAVRLPRRAVFFGPENPDDGATALSARELLAPLAAEMLAHLGPATPAWDVGLVRGAAAEKARLRRLLGGDQTPALLFTASHGMGFPKGDPLQTRHQGALLCQDWPGPVRWHKPIPADHYFSADNVTADANLLGLVAFHFACYGAGTPRLDDFPTNSLRAANVIADRAFVARLPQRLLGHPAGGALAVIGHVERAWGYSILWQDAGRHIEMFKAALRLLMEGSPVGWATEVINQRYADIGTDLSAELFKARQTGLKLDPFDIARRWTANNDARGYAVIGDPAVRLPLATGSDTPTRPAFDAPVRLDLTLPPPNRAPIPAAGSAPPQEIQMSETNSSRPAIAGTVTLTVPLQVTIQLGSGGAFTAASFGTGAAVNIDPDYGNREGYDPAFLGGAAVAMPGLSAGQRQVAARVSDTDEWADELELKYHHFSVVMNAARQLAFFTAVNIDGMAHRQGELRRGKDKWYFDPRIPKSAQFGEELYRADPFDRGHLVRRLDPAWGRTSRVAKTANDDTFHFTNCSPQHERFNQGKNLWAGLEDYLLEKATGEQKRLTVFTGPVFEDDDPEYRGVRIPKRFWKVAVVGRPGGRVAALGFIVSQEKLLRSMGDVSFDPTAVAETFQTSVANVEAAAGLSFGELKDVDAGGVQNFAPGQPPLRKLDDLGDIQMGG